MPWPQRRSTHSATQGCAAACADACRPLCARAARMPRRAPGQRPQEGPALHCQHALSKATPPHARRTHQVDGN